VCVCVCVSERDGSCGGGGIKAGELLKEKREGNSCRDMSP